MSRRGATARSGAFVALFALTAATLDIFLVGLRAALNYLAEDLVAGVV